MHTSGGAACGPDDGGADAPELCVCRSLPRTKIKEYSPRVNGRITTRQDHDLQDHDRAIDPGAELPL